MFFWRKKKNQKTQDEEIRDDKLLHPEGAPEIEPSTDYEAEISDDQAQALQKTESEILKETDVAPTPVHTITEDAKEADELSDHSDEGGWLSRLTSGLSKSTNKITQGLSDILTKRKLDQDMLEELEDLLITADLGPSTAAKIVAEFAENRFDKEIDDLEVKEALAAQIEKILTPAVKPLAPPAGHEGPFVILMTGVNGVGKTTTIGKLAQQYKTDGKKVVMAAADTFRAAAVDQLSVWAERAYCPIVKKDIGADPAAVAYESLEKAQSENFDILMIDTAGRLHNKKNLMEELQKVVRVLKKKDETAPHAVLLVLDATTGQNAHAQLKAFKDLVDISGLIVTKLDGSAKGGVLVSLADEFGLPVHAIGVGEGISDLQPFEARHFARSLMGLDV